MVILTQEESLVVSKLLNKAYCHLLEQIYEKKKIFGRSIERDN